MEPDQEKEKKYKPSEDISVAQVSLVRKILIGIFIVGYWVFFYWFREP